MRGIRNTALVALSAATLAFASGAFAQDKMMKDDDHMMADEQMADDHMMADEKMADDHMMADEGHPMMHMEVTCSAAGMSDTGGMMIEFHNMGGEAIPAGSTAHWKMRGVAQGDVHFMEAVAPGGMKMQNYMADEMVHMSGHAPCSAEMMK